MTPRPAVSVLMTAFNRERYVGAAIESVLAQTFTDFELIVVDDCSTDGTVAVVRRYLSDPRVRVVQNERNLGDYPNRNRAAALAVGEYLKYHDSDDLMYPHCLSVMVGALSAEPTAAFALSAHRAWSGGPSPMLLTPRLAYEREFFGEGLFNFGPASALFRREMFASAGGFPERGSHSDTLFWLTVCSRVNVLLVSGDLYWYRLHPAQEMRGANAAYQGAALEWEWLAALDSPNCPLAADARERAKRNAVGRVIRAAVRDLRRRDVHLAWFRLRHTRLSWRDWLRYASWPDVSPRAGTPLTDEGEIVVPAALRDRRHDAVVEKS